PRGHGGARRAHPLALAVAVADERAPDHHREGALGLLVPAIAGEQQVERLRRDLQGHPRRAVEARDLAAREEARPAPLVGRDGVCQGADDLDLDLAGVPQAPGRAHRTPLPGGARLDGGFAHGALCPQRDAECILHLRYLPRRRPAIPHHREMATTTRRPMLVLAGIALAALALRPQIIAIGPLVDAIDSDLGVSPTVTGLLGTIPLLCMGLFAPAAGPLAARIGATRAMTLVLLTIGIAGIARSVAPGAAGVIALTVPIGIGIAIGNVLAPVIVKTAFSDRPLLATGLFAFGIQIGAGAAGALAVPLADALGSWRDSLFVISLVCSAVALAWIPVARA